MKIVADVLIRGGGVAACCCAHLLTRAGLRVGWMLTDRPRLPVILIGNATQALIEDVFEKRDLFKGCHRIERRTVAWQRDAGAVTVEHSAVVVSEERLLDLLRPPLQTEHEQAAPWTVFSSQALLEHHFGSRIASVVPIEFNGDAHACFIESLEAGWLFLIPTTACSGWMLSVGGAHEDLLSESRLIAKQIARAHPPIGTFAAYPRMAEPLAGPGWLACGTAAMAFDPICGDGTGNAIREAILAAAVIRAALKGGGADSLLAHYENRLRLGFKRHLALCLDFYRSGRRGLWWDREVESLIEGIEWCAGEPRFEYQLDGFELRPVSRGG